MPVELSGKVIATRMLSPANKHLAIQLDPSFTFQPGQYVFFEMIKEGRRLLRAYSIASSPHHKGVLEFCVTKVDGGFASNYLHSLNIGDEVKLKGPYGKFILQPSENDLLFIATGSGVAPFRSIIHHELSTHANRHISLVFGVRHEEDILYKEEWEDMTKKHSNLHITITLSRPQPTWQGVQGYVQTKLEQFIDRKDRLDVYICGVNKMITDVRATLHRLRFPESSVYYERYD